MQSLPLTDRTVHFDSATVESPAGTVHLTELEVRLLQHFARHAGQALTRETLLADVWGYRGSTPTRTVAAAIKRLRKKIEADPGTPRHILTVYGEGYRFEGLDMAADPGPRPSAIPSPAPSSTAPIGRDAEWARALDLQRRCAGLVTVTGPIGVGKSHLVRQLFPAELHNHVWVDLSQISQRHEVLHATAKALGCSASEVSGCLSRTTHRILVLDQLDSARGPAFDLLQAWAAAAPGRVWCTARGPLGLPDEHVVFLEPLDTSSPECDAVRLLQSFIEQGGAPHPPAPTDLLELARALDGIPLLLQLAADQSRVLPLRAMVDRIHTRLRWLRSTRRNGTSLVAELTAAHALLPPKSQSQLHQLAVFPVAFQLDDAESVVETDAEDWLPDTLATFVDHGWLLPPDPHGRYRILGTTRLWLRSAADPALRQAAEDRFVSTVLRHCHAPRTGVHYPSQHPEMVLAALEREASPERHPEALAYAALRACEGLGLPARLLALLPDALLLALPDRTPLQVARGAAHTLAGELESGWTWLQRAAANEHAETPTLDRVQRLRWSAINARLRANPRHARELLEQALPLAAALDDRLLEGLCWVVLQQVESNLDRRDACTAAMERALRCFYEAGDTERAQTSRANLAYAYRRDGRLSEACALYRDILDHIEPHEASRRAPLTLNLAFAEWLQGDAALALERSTVALASEAVQSQARLRCRSEGMQALARYWCGEPRRSLDQLRRVVTELRSLGDTRTSVRYGAYLVDLLLDHGFPTRARLVADELEALLPEVETPSVQDSIRALVLEVATLHGTDATAALAELADMQSRFESYGDLAERARHTARMVRVAQQTGTVPPTLQQQLALHMPPFGPRSPLARGIEGVESALSER